MILVAVASLIAWIIFFIKKKYSVVLVLSVLLVIIGVPYIFALNKVLSHDRPDQSLLYFLMFVGGACISLG